MNKIPLEPLKKFSLDGVKPYVITEKENRELCQSVNCHTNSKGYAHPIYYYVATQVGMGKSIDELCKVCGCDVSVGPRIVDSKVTFMLPLKVNQPYEIKGEIIDLTRKKSNKFGLMDIVTYKLSMLLPNGDTALTTTNSWVLPRRDLV